MTIFYSSDEHFGHLNIIKYCNRNFSTIEEMNKALIDNHNATVSSEDTTYHLGDFSMSDKIVPEILKQLNGTHILIPGNHDKCHPAHKNYQTKITEYLSYGFKEIHIELMQDIPGIGLVKFNHLPYNDPGFDDNRYAHLKPKPSGEKYLFHGHVHTSWKRRDNMINLGVDQWEYKPVSLDQVISFLNE
jgi:calcineurin-like phosphoesterase family protein